MQIFARFPPSLNFESYLVKPTLALLVWDRLACCSHFFSASRVFASPASMSIAAKLIC
jgi:hypothetical protein